MGRAVILALGVFVVGTGATVETLDAMTGRPIEATVRECADHHGACAWRVAFGDALGAFHRRFAFVPGLLVYPLAPIAALAAWHRSYLGARRAFWRALSLACVAVLLRFFWLGVFTAVTH